MKNHQHISQAIWQKIQAAENILLFSHQSPDGDTLGSNLALAKYLKNIGKQVTSFCIDPVPDNLKFLPNYHWLDSDHIIFTKKYEVVIALDSGSLDYAGVESLLTALNGNFSFINIDHHASNTHYGQINLVIPDASSTAEVVYRLLKDWNIDWDSDIANCLACGLITDTGGFKNAATSYLSLSAAADLHRQGAKLQHIINKTINNTEFQHLKLWGRALARLQSSKQYQLVYTFLTQADFQECGVDGNKIEGLSNFLHILNEGKIVLILKEDNNNAIRGSLRTNTNIDLAKLAKAFGGGGHKKASGFILPGRLEYVNNKLKVV